MYRGFNGGWMNGGVPFMGNWGGMVMIIVVVAALVLGIVAVVRTGKARQASVSAASDRALEILAERFARGEIDADSFRSMKAELEATS
jgi:putative membrane protein